MGDWNEHGSTTGGYYKCNKYEAKEGEGDNDVAKAKAELDRYLHYYKRRVISCVFQPVFFCFVPGIVIFREEVCGWRRRRRRFFADDVTQKIVRAGTQGRWGHRDLNHIPVVLRPNTHLRCGRLKTAPEGTDHTHPPAVFVVHSSHELRGSFLTSFRSFVSPVVVDVPLSCNPSFARRYQAHDSSQQIAEKQQDSTERRMVELQESSAGSAWIDVQFLKTAMEQLIECRRVLK